MSDTQKPQPTEQDLRAILKRYVQAEDETLAEIASQIEAAPGGDEQKRKLSKQRVLKEIELHARAELLVEEAVSKYREDLYFVSRRFSEEDGESGVITGTHVHRAQSVLNRQRKGYSWSDAVLAIGGLCAGAGLPQLLQGRPPSLPEIVSTILGALLLGIGIMAKAK
jgi:hypothetical protein